MYEYIENQFLVHLIKKLDLFCLTNQCAVVFFDNIYFENTTNHVTGFFKARTHPYRSIYRRVTETHKLLVTILHVLSKTSF